MTIFCSAFLHAFSGFFGRFKALGKNNGFILLGFVV